MEPAQVTAGQPQPAEHVPLPMVVGELGEKRQALHWDGNGTTTIGVTSMRLPAPPSSGPFCPVTGAVSFTDTFGAPREGRTHQGVDMFAMSGGVAVSGRIIVAPVSGTTFLVENVDDDIGGISMWIRASNGDEYFFAHNSVNLVTSNDVQVSAGQNIAKTGNTGNAATTPPHLHFEIHPGAGRQSTRPRRSPVGTDARV